MDEGRTMDLEVDQWRQVLASGEAIGWWWQCVPIYNQQISATEKQRLDETYSHRVLTQINEETEANMDVE